MMKKISIIIPIHNNEKQLSRCLNSFLIQKYEKLELICVDDHSRDNSLKICQQYANQYENIILKRLPKHLSGVSNARNYGLEVATGDIIGFSDADDTSVMGALHCVNNDFEKNNNLKVVNYSFNVIDRKNNRKVRGKKEVIRSDNFINYLLYKENVQGFLWNKYFDKKIINNIRFRTCLSKAEDLNFIFRVLAASPDAVVIISNRFIYNYCYNDNSVSHTNTKNSDFDYLNSYLDLLNLKGISKRTHSILKYRIYKQARDIKRIYTLNSEERDLLDKLLKSCLIDYIGNYKLGWKDDTFSTFKHVLGHLFPQLKNIYRKLGESSNYEN